MRVVYILDPDQASALLYGTRKYSMFLKSWFSEVSSEPSICSPNLHIFDFMDVSRLNFPFSTQKTLISIIWMTPNVKWGVLYMLISIH